MSTQWLSHKRIVVIGGTDGLGLSASLAFIRQGAKVVAVGKDSSQEEDLNTEFATNGLALTNDARQESTAVQAIETCVNRFGGFDALYHVAGGSGRKFGDAALHEITADGWNQTFQLNLTSMMYSNKAALKYFMDNNQAGAILNMGSVLGYSPSPKYFSTHAYAACKSAVIGLSKSLASYYAPHNIRVNVIAPALVKTPMSKRAADDEGIMHFIQTKQPLDGGRIGLPDDTDGAAVFLLSDHAKFITGQVIAVDGGWSVTEGQY